MFKIFAGEYDGLNPVDVPVFYHRADAELFIKIYNMDRRPQYRAFIEETFAADQIATSIKEIYVINGRVVPESSPLYTVARMRERQQ